MIMTYVMDHGLRLNYLNLVVEQIHLYGHDQHQVPSTVIQELSYQNC